MNIQEFRDKKLDKNDWSFDFKDAIGWKVKVIELDGTLSDKVFTIESFDDNMCGEGCCYAYTLVGEALAYWPSKLEIVEQTK